VELLARELELLVELPHPVLTVDVSGCRFKEVEGMLALLQLLRRLGERDGHLAIVAGTGWMADLLEAAGIDELVPVFPNQEAAARPLHAAASPLPEVPVEEGVTPGAPHSMGSTSWEEARAEAVAYWQVIREALAQEPPEEVLAYLTAMTPLCERAEESFRQRFWPAAWRCQLCPLFHALGGRPQDVGCRSLQDPVIAAVRAGDGARARALVEATIRFLEVLPLPESELPDPILLPRIMEPGNLWN
jgi:anti-anti-sigma regulatory factor